MRRKASLLTLANYDGGGFPDNFAARTGKAADMCLQPLVTRKIEFERGLPALEVPLPSLTLTLPLPLTLTLTPSPTLTLIP